VYLKELLFSFVSYDIVLWFYRCASLKCEVPDVYCWLKPKSNYESIDSGNQGQVSLRPTIGLNKEIN